MEYHAPEGARSLVRRLALLWLDLLAVAAILWRFVLDHVVDPCHPQPALASAAEQEVPYYRLSGAQQAETRRRMQEELASSSSEARKRRQGLSREEEEVQTARAASMDEIAAAAGASSVAAASPAVPAPPPPRRTQLRVLNLNIWGLPISPRTFTRVQELCKSFHLFDLIALEEAAHERELKFMRAYCQRIGLRYSHQFSHGVGFPVWHGVTAPALVLFSRYPILDVRYKRFAINGKLYQISHSDYMGAKGVGLVRVDVSEMVYPQWPAGQCRPVVGVDVFLTHLHANYTNFQYDYRKWLPLMREQEEHARAQRAGEQGEDVEADVSSDTSWRYMPIPLMSDIRDEYLAHRVLQCYELARFVAAQRRPDFLTLLCGDLNCPPYDLCTQLFQSLSFGQNPGCVPRLIDAFAELHPRSNGFTCGAKDNTYTFGTEPLRMERRVPPANIARNGSPSNGNSASAAAVRASEGLAKHGNVADVDDDATAESIPHRRPRFRSSPTDPALIPADSSLRISSTHGEHVTLLHSPNVTPQTVRSLPSYPVTHAAAGTSSAVPPASSVSAAQSPLTWLEHDTAKRIDYIFYSNPVAPPVCRCQWANLQLPFQHLPSDDADAKEAAARCTCSKQLDALPPPTHLWRAQSAVIFKQYMTEPDGRMTSISDHHGVSVTFELQLQGAQQEARPTSVTPPLPTGKQPTSIVLISKLPAPSTPATTATATEVARQGISAAASSAMSSASQTHALLPLRRKTILLEDGSQAEEPELFTLDASIPASSTLEQDRANSEEIACSGGGGEEPDDSSASSDGPDAAPALPTSSLLLLASGVLWFGLRDATTRRQNHLVRMAHAFLIFIIGSRSMWVALLNMYWEDIWELYVLPQWMADLPVPAVLIVLARVALHLIDWAHTFLPIYIVLEWLLTTFPAKEEQTAMREVIVELNTLRRFSLKQEREQAARREQHA